MKISKIRKRLTVQLLFAGFKECDISEHWYEVENTINSQKFIVTIHNWHKKTASIRIYTPTADTSFNRFDFALNKNTYTNILKYIENYGR